MSEAVDKRRVRVVYHDREGPGALRHARPLERRRDVLAIAGVALGDPAVAVERGGGYA